MRTKYVFLALMCILMLNGVIHAKDIKQISFDEYFSFIKENLPDLKVNRINVEISKTAVKKIKGTEDINLSGGSSLNRNNYLNTTSGLDYTDTFSAYVGVSKTIADTGTRFSGTYNWSRSTDIGTEEINYYTPSVTVSLTQPVLQNVFGVIDRFARKNAVMQYEIVKLEKQINDASTLTYFQTLYTDWIIYRQITNKMYRNITNAKTVYQQTLRKRNAGLAENDDVQKSFSQLLGYQESYNKNQMALQKIESEIISILGISSVPNKLSADNNSSVPISITTITPNHSYFTGIYKISAKEDYKIRPFTETVQYAVLVKSVEMLKYSREVSENKLLPEMDLFTSLTQKGQQDDFGESVFGLDKTDYSIGFEVNYPLGNNTQKAEYESVVLELKKLNQEIIKATTTYSSNLNYILNAADKTKKIINYKTQNLKALYSQLATEKKKYDQARIGLSYILETKNKIASEEVELLLAKADMVALYNEYINLTR